MSDLRNRYQTILKEIENNIKDEEERKFVIEKFQELSVVFMDIIDRLTYVTDMKVKQVEEKQKEIETKIGEVQKAVDGIESDIYEDEEPYEFEITCPYCNHEFVADINSETNTEVECPECHNVIELDWNGEDECESDCHHCSHGCSQNNYDLENEEADEQYDEELKNQYENDEFDEQYEDDEIEKDKQEEQKSNKNNKNNENVEDGYDEDDDM